MPKAKIAITPIECTLCSLNWSKLTLLFSYSLVEEFRNSVGRQLEH